MIYISEIHMTGGSHHQHISDVRWRNPKGGKCGESTRATMVDWIENKAGKAYVRHGDRDVRVGVVKASTPYLRTYADKDWTNNLLALPKY